MIWNLACWCILAISRNDFGQRWPNCGSLVAKNCEIGVSGHTMETAWKEWPEIWHTDVSWPPPEMIRFWSILAKFGPLELKNLNVLVVSGVPVRTQWWNGPKFGIQMYDDHLQNGPDLGHGLIIYLLLVHFLNLKLIYIYIFVCVWGGGGYFLANALKRMAWKCRGEAYFRLFAWSPV